MRIVIPMAGEGSRFAQAGYTFPKPLVDVAGKPMIQRVVESLGFDGTYIFVVRAEHLEKYNLESLLKRISGGACEIVVAGEPTEGAACSVLLARDFIAGEEELVIANSDQIIGYSHTNFQTLCHHGDIIGGQVFCFNATHPKWSFVECDSVGRILRVAEKDPISDIATCGVYYYRKGRYFVDAADRMIEKDIRVNGEFYVAPVYNEFISVGGYVVPFFVHEMWGVGTPEDLDVYLRR